MNELLAAITNLINTGGSLADDALYLYFALKIIEPLSVTTCVTGVVWLICRTLLKSQELGQQRKS